MKQEENKNQMENFIKALEVKTDNLCHIDNHSYNGKRPKRTERNQLILNDAEIRAKVFDFI